MVVTHCLISYTAEPISTPTISSPATLLEEDTLTLSCTVQGVPHPTILWYKDGELLSPPSSTLSVFPQLFHITEQLTLASVTCLDSGNYSCSAVQVLQSRGGVTLVMNSSVSLYTILCEYPPCRYTSSKSLCLVKNVIFQLPDAMYSFSQ